MAKQDQDAPVADPAQSAEGTASPSPDAAAPEAPGQMAKMEKTITELRTAIGRQGERFKALEAQAAQPQLYAQPPQQQYVPPAANPWDFGAASVGGEEQTISNWTPQQFAQAMQSVAQQAAENTFMAGAENYGLDRIPRQSAIQGINALRMDAGESAVAPEVLQKYAPQVEEILSRLTNNPTPDAANIALKAVMQQEGGTIAAETTVAREAETAASNQVSSALQSTNVGAPSAPPGPDGSTTARPDNLDPVTQTAEQRKAAADADYGGS